MDYIVHWGRIGSRIDGLVRSAKLSAQLTSMMLSALGEQVQYLADHCLAVSKEIISFTETYRQFLPSDVAQVLEGHFVLHGRIEAFASDKANQLHYLIDALVKLVAFEAEVTYLLSSNQQRLISLTERSLTHLQWTILADKQSRALWQSAFENHEPACERLGAAHLLLHGIFGFKAHGTGAATDLIAGERVTAAAAAVAEGLVLTEWKRATSQADADKKIVEGREQANLYKSGLLGGMELRPIRYIVVVSESRLDMPADEVCPGYTFRHINVPVKPLSPSAASKAMVAASS